MSEAIEQGVQGSHHAPTTCASHLELQAKVDRILADADPIDLRDPAVDLTVDERLRCARCEQLASEERR